MTAPARTVPRRFRLYLDESGNHTSNHESSVKDRFLGLAGVAFELDQHRAFSPKLEEFKSVHTRSYDPDDSPVLHREDIIGRRGPFSHLADHSIAAEFTKALVELIEPEPVCLFSVVVDKHTHWKKAYRQIKHPYCYGLNALLERYLFFLENNGAIGDVLAESRGGVEDKLLKQEYARAFDRGTKFATKARFEKFLSSRELKIKNKAANIAGLQIADLFSLPVTRHTLEVYRPSLVPAMTHELDKALKAIATARYHRSGSGKVLGCGQVILG